MILLKRGAAFLRKRVVLLAKVLLILLAVGIVYFTIYTFWGIGILCPLNSLTGLLCPYCGVSRMFISLIKLNFKSALYYNFAFLLLLPIWILIAIFYCREYLISGNKKAKKWIKILIYSSFAIMLIFSILRNTINIGLKPSHSILINNILWR